MKKGHLVVVCLIVGVIFWLTGSQQISAHEKVTLEFYSTVAGTTAYNIHEALTDMLNKKHPWLKASHLETASDAERLALVDELPLKRKKVAIPGYLSIDLVKARLGMKPFRKKYIEGRMVATYMAIAMYFVTYDKNIKTPEDLIGKKVGLFPRGHSMNYIAEPLLKVWGVHDKVKISYHRPTAFKDALTTGIIDVAWATAVPWSKKKTSVSPYAQEILGARKTYWIPITEADQKSLNKMNPFKVGYGVWSKGALGKGNPPNETGFLRVFGAWCTTSVAEDDVIYELAKFIYENADGFQQYVPVMSGDGIREIMAGDPLMSEIGHPGAIRFYKEKGLIK
ncbi:MAG: TAXI family TRAP transporter solute-binding subunit [Deltaproteobacteria bacterium]|nr:TAXI family TRAP transporter solute-binding subunit [Deltaproteobacteria bacterium]